MPSEALDPPPLQLADDAEAVKKSRERKNNLGKNAVEVAAGIGLARKTLFTWLAHGRAHQDALPVDEPSQVPAWYGRMMARGVFKHRCPQSVLDACAAHKAQSPSDLTQGAPEGSASVGPMPPGLMGGFLAGDLEARGIGVEIIALEKRIAAKRASAEQAYASLNDTEGDRLSRQVDEMLETLRKLKNSEENDKVIEQRILAGIHTELAGIFPGIVSNLLFMGGKLHAEVQSGLTRAEFITIFRRKLGECFKDMRETKFAPALGELLAA